MSISADELHKLSVVERLELIDAIWDSIAGEPNSVPITHAQRREIDRRLDSYAQQRLASARGIRCGPGSNATSEGSSHL